MRCPFCQGPMAVQRGLPSWLDVERLVGQHPLPLLGGYVKSRLAETSRVVTQHVTWAKCSGCGYVAFFEK